MPKPSYHLLLATWVSRAYNMRRDLILSGIFIIIGGLCLLGGIGLLIARILQPDAVTGLILSTPSPIPPTQGFLLTTPLAPPSRQSGEIPIMMPVMEVAGQNDIPADQPLETPIPTNTPTAPYTSTPVATKTLIIQQTQTSIAEQFTEQTIITIPTETLTPIPFITPTPTITFTPAPTYAPQQPARIIIPSIDLDAPIQAVWLQQLSLNGQVFSQWRVPERRAVGWHDTSALLGQVGNTVLNGHHNLYGKVFGDLVKVQPGDTIRLEAADHTGINYTVVQTMLLKEEGEPLEVRLENARWLLPSHDERITLVTCWPPDGRSHRLVVIALPENDVTRQ